jgi:hypothetical protein
MTAEAIGNFYEDESVWDSIRNEPRLAELIAAYDYSTLNRD